MNKSSHKNLVVAFLLSFFPGGGQFYYGRISRGLIYFLSITFSFMTAVFFLGYNYLEQLAVILFVLFILYFISFVDTVHVGYRSLKQQIDTGSGERVAEGDADIDRQRFYTILLSFVPGLGHFQLGLMTRGLTFMTVFLGALIMIFFVSFLLQQEAMLLFLFLLPAIWVYCLFDVIQLLNKKERGETLHDRSFLEDLENQREEGRKSKAIATMLAIFPGAGHLYLGYQKRGLQLMAIFLLSIYILDSLRLGFFLFLIPMIWFYSFFDGLQKASLPFNQEVEDQPIIPMFLKYQRWLGIGLIGVGLLFFLDRVLIPSVGSKVLEYYNIDLRWWYNNYFQVTLVSILMIAGGIKLMMGLKTKNESEIRPGLGPVMGEEEE